MTDTKCCAKCSAEKPTSAFSGDPRGKGGVHAYCRDCQRDYNARYRATPKGRVRGLLHDAARRRPVTVDAAWLLPRLEAGRCEVTGIEFDYSPRTDGGHQNPLAPSLDRIDPAGDYTPENTQVVLYAYNAAKGQLHDRDARALLRMIGERL